MEKKKVKKANKKDDLRPNIIPVCPKCGNDVLQYDNETGEYYCISCWNKV